MSLVNLAHLCSHLQNASRARLGLTSIPHTKLHLSIALQLQKQGFISSVQLGAATPPVPSPMRQEYSSASIESVEPQLELVEEVDTDVDANEEVVDPDSLDAIWRATNPGQGGPQPLTHQIRTSQLSSGQSILSQIPSAHRRLWLGLKYWNNQPVISRMSMISKPTKRIWLNSEDIGKIARGREAGHIKGMTGVGECIFVTTDRGILEARECAELKVGGMMLCRVL